MNIESLSLFNTLAETRHFYRCAELAHISPSKLSRVIQQLEKELGAQLFERNNRSVELTHQGREFLKFSRKTLQELKTLKDSAKTEGQELSGSISIYCSVTASYSFLYEILRSFRLAHPKIEITLHTGDAAAAIERVVAGFEDISIAARPDKLPKGVAFNSFATSPLVLVAPKDPISLLESISPTPDETWSKIPLILSERGIARERLNNWLEEQTFTPNIYAQVSGNEAIVSMVSLGFGLGFLPKIVVDNSPLANRVALFPYQPDVNPYDVGCCVQQKRLKSPLVAALWQEIERR